MDGTGKVTCGGELALNKNLGIPQPRKSGDRPSWGPGAEGGRAGAWGGVGSLSLSMAAPAPCTRGARASLGLAGFRGGAEAKSGRGPTGSGLRPHPVASFLCLHCCGSVFDVAAGSQLA